MDLSPDRTKRLAFYQVKSQAADDLAATGDRDGAICLLREQRDLAQAAGDEDYRLFLDGEILHYERQDYAAQMELQQQALTWQKAKGEPDDPFLLRQIGVVCNYLGRVGEAIAFFDRVLAINPEDYRALRQEGVSLSRQGKEEEAIAYYDRALAINPQDHHALRQKGVSLSKQGKEKEAIAYYDRALAINPRDYRTLSQKGASLSKQGKEDEAIGLVSQALAIQPNDAASYRYWSAFAYHLGRKEEAFAKISQAVRLEPEKWKDDFFLLARLLEKDAKLEWEKLLRERERPNQPGTQPSTEQIPSGLNDDPLSDIRGFVASLRRELGAEGNNLVEDIEEAKKRVADFLKPESKRDSARSEFLILRKWNSYTPAIPATDEDNRSKGGGYFLYHGGKGIVIDPGYNFIENFHGAGGMVHDIDAIVLTHAHNDHTTDFESLCTLLHKYNGIVDGRQGKAVDLYLNNGSFKKFSGLLNLQDHSYIGKVCTLNQGNRYSLANGITLSVLPAYHDEIVARDQSVGLLLHVPVEDGSNRKILFTSDTGLFPLKLDDRRFQPNTDGGKELWQAYPEEARDGLDVLVVHIGSVNKNEIIVDLNQGVHECLYPNHLGIIGCCRMISKLPCKLAVVSEFGEELRNYRIVLVRQIDTIVKEVLKDQRNPPVVLPGDLAFRYDIGAHKMYCSETETWVSCENIRFAYKDTTNKEDIRFLSQQAARRL